MHSNPHKSRGDQEDLENLPFFAFLSAGLWQSWLVTNYCIPLREDKFLPHAKVLVEDVGLGILVLPWGYAENTQSVQGSKEAVLVLLCQG